jgi:hypothetical protein
MIVSTEQGAIAQWGTEILQDPAMQCDDGLQVDARAYAVNALNTAKNRRQSIANAVNDIALGVGRNRFVQRNPASGLAGQI